jgi:DNA-binding PadR family transcriptional regulator
MVTGMSELSRPENPLALAMLAILAEGPMHPYEVASTLKRRHGDDAIKIRYGSLYSVIAQLVAREWIVAHETSQRGNRPEHTKYRLTELGRVELTSWLRELIAEPAKEYPRFEAALCLMGALPFAEVAERLAERIVRLDGQIGRLEADLAGVLATGLDPLFLAEAQYRLAMAKAERDYCRALQPQLAARTDPAAKDAEG